MKHNSLISNLLILSVIFLMNSCSSTKKSETNKDEPFKISRGVNLSHWLSQDFGWEAKYTYIKEGDLKFIDSIGYDHVRIPIDEKEMWDESGKPVNEAFSWLNKCLSWCAKYKLRAIVDLHTLRSHHFNAENEGGKNTLWTDSSAQNKFVNLWKQLSQKLHTYPNNMVAYEILNEAVAPTHEDWNNLMYKAVAEIRKTEPERILVIGANLWQQASNLPYVKVPEGDKNIILSFHTYTPMAFTHYKADWTPVKFYKGTVHYPGKIISNEDYDKFVDLKNQPLVNMLTDAREEFNKERLKKVFETAVEFAKAKKLPLYCGEFGCMPTVDRKDRMNYYKDMVTAMEENNIAWCNWEYKGDFGIYFFDLEKRKSTFPDFEMINVLLNSKPKK